jgi:hypothetical protein
MSGVLSSVALQLEAQSLNSIVAGFSFASAVAWMDFVRYIVANVIKVNKTGASFYALAALLTTLLAIAVYLVVKTVAFNVKVKEPSQVLYAVTK